MLERSGLPPRPPGRRWRWFWRCAIALLLSLALAFAGVAAHQIARARASERLLDAVDRLVLLSPTDCSRAEWQVAVYHTHSLHCALIPQVYSTRAELNALHAALQERARGECSLDLIDWLWGEYCRITPARASAAVRERERLQEQTELIVTTGDVYDDYGSFERFIRQRAGNTPE